MARCAVLVIKLGLDLQSTRPGGGSRVRRLSPELAFPSAWSRATVQAQRVAPSGESRLKRILVAPAPRDGEYDGRAPSKADNSLLEEVSG
jgi:hypothetical protein